MDGMTFSIPEGMKTPWGVALGLHAAYVDTLAMPASVERRRVLNALHHAIDMMKLYHEGSSQAADSWPFETEHHPAPGMVLRHEPKVKA